MENKERQPEAVRFGFGLEGKLVRDLIVADMIRNGEQPGIIRPVGAERAKYFRAKLKEELAELEQAVSLAEQIKEAADFMAAALAFHARVEADQSDSELFGQFQKLVRERRLDMNLVEVKRLELREKKGEFDGMNLVRSVLIGPDNPRYDYYDSNPKLFPRLE